MKKDFLKNDLNIGDEVIFIGRFYKNFETGIIVKFTRTTVVIKPIEGLTIRRAPNTVIKITT